MGNTQYFRTKPDQDLEVKEVLDLVYNAMDEKGYNPVNQIVGYIMSGRSDLYYQPQRCAKHDHESQRETKHVEELLNEYIKNKSWERYGICRILG